MANSKSAEKRIEINKRNRLRNKYYKTSVRTLTKIFFQTLKIYKTSQNPKEEQKLKELLSSVYSVLDKGTKKNVFHRNTAARKKARLVNYLRMV